MKKNNNFPFPPEKELKEMCQKLSASDYPYVNYILPANANSNERMKYNLCKTILRYQRENDISDTKLTKILGVNKDKLIDILFAKVYNLELNELLTYFDNLHIPFEIKIINNRENKRIRV
jgi:hypothetical protein